MTQTVSIKAEYVDLMPSTMKEGIVYISNKYKTAMHLCPCGCGNKVATPLKQGGWEVSVIGGLVSLNPSVSNSSFPCRSHYFISNGSVRWERKLSDSEIESAWSRDHAAREVHFDRPTESMWQKIWMWIRKKIK